MTITESTRFSDLPLSLAKEVIREIVREELTTSESKKVERPLSVKEVRQIMGWNNYTTWWQRKKKYGFKKTGGGYLLSEIKSAMK